MTQPNATMRGNRVLLALLATTAAAFAIAPARPAFADTPATSLTPASMPAEQHYDGVAYATGGVGANEAKAFEQNMNKYPLAIELLEKVPAAKRDEFTANAQVSITDHTGKEVFKATAGGPFMLVQLQPGKYSMTATLGQRTIRRANIMVEKGKTARETVVFPSGTN
jgi:hypothetical protein